jgi:hypothetical protein
MIRPDYSIYVEPHYSLLIDDDSHFERLCSFSGDPKWSALDHLTAGDSYFDEFWRTFKNKGKLNDLGEPTVDWALITNPSETLHKGCALFLGNYTLSVQDEPLCAICFDGFMDTKIVDF